MQSSPKQPSSIISNLVTESGSHYLKVTASLGLTSFNYITDDRSGLLARADKALYQAKQDGGNCISVVPCSITS
ncbi:MAG: diguanylate cyclase [Gammaproteobacteria bacterium]|nr:diguanylate cyclase [Gammaproteobacteria bacterium]